MVGMVSMLPTCQKPREKFQPLEVQFINFQADANVDIDIQTCGRHVRHVRIFPFQDPYVRLPHSASAVR